MLMQGNFRSYAGKRKGLARKYKIDPLGRVAPKLLRNKIPKTPDHHHAFKKDPKTCSGLGALLDDLFFLVIWRDSSNSKLKIVYYQ